MKKKQDETAAHELRDCPVPPVKGAVTDESDVWPRPKQPGTAGNVNFGDSGTLESWL